MLNTSRITQDIPDAFSGIDIPHLGEKLTGKVRDIYKLGPERRILIATDRVSAFDRNLGLIPHRGQVLNELAAWWFNQTTDIVPNHVLEVIDPNVTVAREAEAIPIEVVIRGYITGVTDTSMWMQYQNGNRTPYGIELPDGLNKNDPLPEDAITPTTKAANGHDERLTPAEIIERGIVSQNLWDEIVETAKALYAAGKRIARENGLILVDTKYEFGLINGRLHLIDEVHTPDSSRYWDAAAHSRGRIAHFDKEYMRMWFYDQGYRGEGPAPLMPDGIITTIAKRYIAVYERLTGDRLVPGERPTEDRIRNAVLAYSEDHAVRKSG